MANAQIPVCGQFWLREYNSLQSEYKDIISKYPDADEVLREVYKVLGDIVSLAGCTPANIGTCTEWSRIVDSAKESRIGLCKCLKGKNLFSALYDTYSVTLGDLKSVLQGSASKPNSCKATAAGQVAMEAPEDGFREQRRRKRNNSEELRQSSNKKAALQAAKTYVPRAVAATRNYFAPLRTTEMDTAENDAEGEHAAEEQQQAPSLVAGRPPPIVLTSDANLILLQKQLKGLVKGSFEFRSTRNGIQVITKEMADYSAIRAYFDSNHLHHFTFHPKSEKPIKAVIRQLPGDTPAEDISNGLQDLGFSIPSMKQMTANRPSPEGGSHAVNLPPFL
jgi:hypothetical protein